MIEKLFDTHLRVPVVYVMYGFNGKVVYVGKTNNIHTRWSAHKKSSKSVVNPDDVNAVVLYVMEDEDASLMYEAELIHEHKPAWNTRYPAYTHKAGSVKPLFTTTYDCLMHLKEQQDTELLQQRIADMDKVRSLREQGLSKSEACEKVGISFMDYIRNVRFITRRMGFNLYGR